MKTVAQVFFNHSNRSGLAMLTVALLLAGCTEWTGDAEDAHDHGDAVWAVTAWGEHFEIFAEADPLVVGQTSKSHTHVTFQHDVLLVTRYQELLGEGIALAEAVRKGSEERLALVLMTALTAGLALVPLILAGHKPGNEIQSPMGLVILGGLLTSTFLNAVLVPILFTRWGGREPVTRRDLVES